MTTIKTTVGIAGSIVILGGAVLLGSSIPQETVKDLDMTSFAFQVEQKEDVKDATTTVRNFEYTTLDEDLKLVRKENSVTVNTRMIKNMCMDGVYGSTAIISLVPTEKECDDFIEYTLQQNQKWALEGEVGRLNQLKYK